MEVGVSIYISHDTHSQVLKVHLSEPSILEDGQWHNLAGLVFSGGIKYSVAHYHPRMFPVWHIPYVV